MNQAENQLQALQNIYLIYGAHLVALECFRYLCKIGKRELFLGFAVTELEGNHVEIECIPVRQIKDYSSLAASGDCFVILAMPEKPAVQHMLRT